MRQGWFPVERALDVFASHDELETVPLACSGRGVADPLDGAAFAVDDLPEDEIVLERICPDRQVVAIWFEIEQDAGALVDAALERLEPHGDLALAEVIDALGDRIGVVG